jgi:hypothetical protein
MNLTRRRLSMVAPTMKSRLLATLVTSALSVVLLLPDAMADSPPPKTGRTSDTPQKSSTKGTTTKSPSASILANNPELFEDMARFFRNLPAKSREHIWDHYLKVEIEGQNGKKHVLEWTEGQDQITAIITDLIIVHIKGQDRTKKALSPKVVRPVAEPAAKWIFDNYSSLYRAKFISEEYYFADMLEQYQHFL